MEALFATGRIIDIILILVVLELCAFSGYYLIKKRGIAPLDMLCNLLSGIFLLLALRSALVGESWMLIGGLMFAALIAHLIDVWRRLRKAPLGNRTNL